MRSWVALASLALGVCLTTGAAWYAAAAADMRDRLRFAGSVETARATIETRLGTYLALLHAGAALFDASQEVTRHEFHLFVERLDLAHTYPGVQGIGFSARVAPDARAAIVARLRREGVPDFRIWPEAPGAEEYHTIVFLEPLDRRNREAIGYDMSTDPVRREAMVRARDTGQPAASGRVTLVQEIDRDRQAGFLVYTPVYEMTGTPATREARASMLRGFVYSPFRAADLVRSLLAPERRWPGPRPSPVTPSACSRSSRTCCRMPSSSRRRAAASTSRSSAAPTRSPSP
jgi:CHASE1-domain containing sensor protein